MCYQVAANEAKVNETVFKLRIKQRRVGQDLSEWESTLPVLLTWTPASEVMLDEASEVTGAQGNIWPWF